jgi:hypothetical protein
MPQEVATQISNELASRLVLSLSPAFSRVFYVLEVSARLHHHPSAAS